MNNVYLLLGANLGNPSQQLQSAAKMVAQQLGNIIARSEFYRSEAWGVEEQPDFYNQVLSVETDHTARETLHICQHIENTLGRVRKEKWGARVIDIDILYFNTEIIDSDDLKVPHPYLHLRRFTLLPLTEIVPNFVHPILGDTNDELLAQCPDTLSVFKI